MNIHIEYETTPERVYIRLWSSFRKLGTLALRHEEWADFLAKDFSLECVPAQIPINAFPVVVKDLLKEVSK